MRRGEAGVVTTYLVVLLLMSVFCNGTIGCVFYSKPQLLTVSNSLVLNLACCQLGEFGDGVWYVYAYVCTSVGEVG